MTSLTNHASTANRRLLIMYGSQTGVAESIAKSLHEKIVLNNTSQNNSNIEAVIVECNKYKRTGLKNGLFDEKRVIIVCSTTGNADAPDNCDRFWRYIKRRSHPSDLLKGLEYCVLGLGDTNYDKFCYMGEMIDKRMSELGAHRFYHLGKADDAVGLETVVEPWIDGLLQIVNTQEDDNNNINNNNNGSSNDNSINKNNIIDTTVNVDMGTPMNNIDNNNITNGDDINFCPLQPKDSSLKTLVENVDRTTSAMPRVPSCDFNVVYSDLICAEKNKSGLDNSAPNSPINNSDTGRKWALSNPCKAKIVGARYLTKGGSKAERRVIHLDIQLPLQMQGSSVRRDSFNNAVPALKYAPGDAVGIICPNNTKLINWLLKRLGLYKFADKYFELQRIGAIGASKRAMRQATKAMSIPMHHRTPRLALTHHVDFSGPIRRSTIKKFACFCSDNKERLQMEKLGGPEGREEYTLLIEQQKAGFAEVLAMFPSCKPSIDSILNILPSLMPRYYSVASSPLDDPAIMSIAFTVLEYEIRIPKATSGEWTHGGEYEDHDIFVSKRKGLCTTWLEEICGPFLSQQNEKNDNNVASLTHPELSIFVREAKEFILPASTKWPLIFVGPGTGVAPFVGFLLHRAALKQKNEAEKDDVCSGYWRMGFEIEDEIEEDVGLDIATGLDIGIDDEEYGPIHLFFGNRNKDQDFLYEEELKRLKTDGVLSSLHTAFSRDQEKKIYVQDRMKENGGKIAKIILQDNGYFYVCGDGAKMAYDVDRALIDIIVTHGNKYFRNQQEEVMNVYDNDGNLTAEMAKYILKDMKERQRYVKDVWS